MELLHPVPRVVKFSTLASFKVARFPLNQKQVTNYIFLATQIPKSKGASLPRGIDINLLPMRFLLFLGVASWAQCKLTQQGSIM